MSALRRKPTRRQDQTGAGARTGARLVYISKQAPNALNSSLTRKGASIEIMSMARGLTTGQVGHGQEPPAAYSMSGVFGHRVHGGDPTQNVHGTSDKLMLVVDKGRGMAHHADAIGSDGRQYATEGQGGAADRRRGGDQGRIDGFWWRGCASLCARGRQGDTDRHPRRSGRARGGCAPCRWP